MHRVFTSLLFASALLAQSTTPPVTLTLGGPLPIPVKPGTAVTFTATLSNTAGSNLSALQFTFPFPNSQLTFALGAAAAAANKTITCSGPAAICVIAGVNQTPIGDGVVASFTWVPNLPGTFSYNTTNDIGATSAAKALAAPLSAGQPLQVIITSPCDINADGKTDMNDILAYINTFIFSMPVAGTVNPIGSGSSIVDVQRIATAGTPGGACVIGQ